MNGTTWALLSAYAQHLKKEGETVAAERLAAQLFTFEPPGRELSEAMSRLRWVRVAPLGRPVVPLV